VLALSEIRRPVVQIKAIKKGDLISSLQIFLAVASVSDASSRAWKDAPGLEGRYKATWKREFKLPWREAGPPKHLDD